MKKTHIKSLNEFYSQTLTGDSYNSSNGVFKVNYKPFSDLSISVGRDPDPTILIKDSRFQVGDFVKGNVKGKRNKIEGEIIETSKSQDGKSYIIKIQSYKDKKTHSLIPGSIEFIADRGNSTNVLGVAVSAREKMAQNAKYSGGNVVWGSLESEDQDFILSNPENSDSIEGPMGTGWKVKLVNSLPSGDYIIDPDNQLIYFLRINNTQDLKNKLKSIESYCFTCYHPDLKEYPEELRAIMSIVFLEMKNEQDAKKHLIQLFPSLVKKSYGECRDEHLTKATEIINSFL